jgi:hypothetical protein
MNRFQWTPAYTIGAIAILALLAAIAVGSYHTTAGIGANLRHAGIAPQDMHPWHPAGHNPG